MKTNIQYTYRVKENEVWPQSYQVLKTEWINNVKIKEFCEFQGDRLGCENFVKARYEEQLGQ